MGVVVSRGQVWLLVELRVLRRCRVVGSRASSRHMLCWSSSWLNTNELAPLWTRRLTTHCPCTTTTLPLLRRLLLLLSGAVVGS